MLIYVTEYATTKGIYTVDAVVHCKGFASYIDEIKESVVYLGKEGKGWGRTASEAIEIGEKMRLSAIATAERRIAKLKAMKIEVVETP